MSSHVLTSSLAHDTPCISVGRICLCPRKVSRLLQLLLCESLVRLVHLVALEDLSVELVCSVVVIVLWQCSLLGKICLSCGFRLHICGNFLCLALFLRRACSCFSGN